MFTQTGRTPLPAGALCHNTGKKYSLFALLLAIGLFGQLAVFAQLNTGDQNNRGFEDGPTSTNWIGSGTGSWLINDVAPRTGVNAAFITTNHTGGYYLRNSTQTLSVLNTQYLHVIAWARRGSNTNARIQVGSRFNSNDVYGTTSSLTTTYQRFTTNRLNNLGSTQTAIPHLRSFTNSGGTSVEVYFDDIVIYTSANSTTDVTKPNAASCFQVSSYSSSGIGLSWTNGSDPGTNPTGLRGTLILRTINTSAPTPSLNDQATYTNTNIATDGVTVLPSVTLPPGLPDNWTVIGNVANTTTSFTDNTATLGVNYRYAIVHYDLALNYSTATVLDVSTPRISQSVANLTRPSGGTFQPGDSVEIKVTVDYAVATPIYNVKTRIYVDPNLTYKSNSMRVKDNKGFNFSDPTAPSASCSGTAYTGATGNISGLLDGPLTDMGVYNAIGRYADIMLGERPTASTITSLETGIGNKWGGRIIGRGNTTIPSYYNVRSIVVASIVVIIPSSAAIGEIYNISSSTFYSYTENATAAQLLSFNVNSTENPDLFTQIVVSDPTLPASYTSRGANLFTAFSNGTFGEGTNIEGPGVLSSSALEKIPIATGAPGDGYYAIAKNSAGNQLQTSEAVAINSGDRVFTHWYIAGDHTGTNDAIGNVAAHRDSTRGYMLIVNSDYVPTRVVEQTISGLCPGTFYNFKAWFKNVCPSCGVNSNLSSNIRDAGSGVPNSATDPRRQGVKPSLTFDVNNQAYYTTGPIDISDGWIQKQFVFATGASSGDFTFSIRNNAPGGDGNDWAIDDISIITRGPSASVNVDADPVIDPEPTAFCIGQRFQVLGNWIESTGSFSQYDAYQFQWAYNSNGPWNAIGPVMELTTPNDPFNPANGRIDSIISDQFTDANREVYFRVVIATQPSNISLADAAPCQVTAYNSSVIRIGTCVLPIKLLRFKAASFGQQVLLNWASADIDRLQHFIIERSTNGVDFTPVSTVDPKSYVRQYQYQLTDLPNTNADQLWYRLKMVHMNNEITYSAIEMVGWKKSVVSLNIQPNPARDVVQLNWSGVKPNQKMKLSISNATGTIIHTQSITIQQGPTQQLRLPANMSAGLYFVHVEDNVSGFKQSIKLNKL
ncbi:T9SS type A sorting domain-containing protein [Phnomibacter sp. MR]|uniref:T9SS type A sorting domain-containing protein n=1 Tax=Phnomibacter sp. MR TaxID=3042318 RepID=UPI003A806304